MKIPKNPQRLVIIESPYAGNLILNIKYARACARDCLMRGEVPYASHIFFTQPGILDDQNLEERSLGMRAGLEIAKRADATVVYEDLGTSRGMVLGIQEAVRTKRPVEKRKLGKDWETKHDELVKNHSEKNTWGPNIYCLSPNFE